MSNRSKENQDKANQLTSDFQEEKLKYENEKTAEQINNGKRSKRE